MATIKDWALVAAMDIYDGRDASVVDIRDVILQHCPFLPDTAYMPVPRCETCRHWDHYEDTPFMDDDGLCGVLGEQTNKDFGCVKWETK